MSRMLQPGRVSTFSIDISSKLRPDSGSRHLHFSLSSLSVIFLEVVVVVEEVVAEVVHHSVVVSV